MSSTHTGAASSAMSSGSPTGRDRAALAPNTEVTRQAFSKARKVLTVSRQAMKTEQDRSVSVRARIVAREEPETIRRLKKIVLE